MHDPEIESGKLARYYETRESRWMMCPGESAIVAASIHDGHDLSAEVAARLKLDEATRLREEDPCTYRLTPVADNRIAVSVSRFVVDVNRPRHKAVYRSPEDAWGLDLWREAPTQSMIEHALALYDAFYAELELYLRQIEAKHGFFVVLDLHSYNHRRLGPKAPPEDPEKNPDINIGTGTLLDRQPWEPLIGRFITDLRSFDYFGRRLDVRENVRFFGGYMAQWIHTRFRGSACVLSVEFKKIFMDEWSGQIDLLKAERLHSLLKSAIPGLETSLRKMGARP